MKEKIIDELMQQTEIEDLPESVQQVAELIGLENLMKLSKCINGNEIYIPIPEAIVRKARNRNILKEYTGYNSEILAEKYGLTPKGVRRIVREYDPTQYSIFDVFDDDGNFIDRP